MFQSKGFRSMAMAPDFAGTGDQADLLLKIARCPIAKRCLGGEHGLGCETIVKSQRVDSTSLFQSPEPWSGHLSIAPILFLSSNPSIGSSESVANGKYPNATWDEESTVEYFEYRFGGKPLSSVEEGIYHASPGTTRARRGIPFWIQVRARAAELLSKSRFEVVAGTDYALTEIVRCKSKGEKGVAEALATCAGLYLEPTLEQSAATVLVVLGAHAKRTICDKYGLEPTVSLHGPILVANRMRHVVFLPHPTGWASPKTFKKLLTPADFERLSQSLTAPEPCSTA